MKNLKLILAYLDWSTYATDGSRYNFPKTLCPLFWRTIFSLVCLPVTWLSTITNLIWSKDFRNEDCNSALKLNWVKALVVNILIGLMGKISHDVVDHGWGWDIFRFSDPMLLSYLKLTVGGLIMVAVLVIALLLISGIIYGCVKVFDIIKNSSRKHGREPQYSNEPSAVSKVYGAIKDKYCPIIDWSEIKSKEE